MSVKSWGFVLLIGGALNATNLDLHYRPEKGTGGKTRHIAQQSPLINIANPEKKALSIEKARLERRIEWLESLKKLVHHRHNGSKIFPYDTKIKFLKKHLRNLENSEKNM